MKQGYRKLEISVSKTGINYYLTRRVSCGHREELLEGTHLEFLGARSLHLFALALGEQNLVHVGEHTTGSDGDVAEEDVELFVVANGQLEVAGDDAAALVVASGVSGELQNLSAQIFEDGGQVDGSAGCEAGGKVLLAHVAGNAANRELESGACRAAGALSLGATSALSFSFSFAGHFGLLSCGKFVETELKVLKVVCVFVCFSIRRSKSPARSHPTRKQTTKQ